MTETSSSRIVSFLHFFHPAASLCAQTSVMTFSFSGIPCIHSFFQTRHRYPCPNDISHLSDNCRPRQIMSNRTQTCARVTNLEEFNEVFQDPDGRHDLNQTQETCSRNPHFCSTHQQSKPHRRLPRPVQNRAFLSRDQLSSTGAHTLRQPLSVRDFWCHADLPANRVQNHIQPLSSNTRGGTHRNSHQRPQIQESDTTFSELHQASTTVPHANHKYVVHTPEQRNALAHPKRTKIEPSLDLLKPVRVPLIFLRPKQNTGTDHSRLLQSEGL